MQVRWLENAWQWRTLVIQPVPCKNRLRSIISTPFLYLRGGNYYCSICCSISFIFSLLEYGFRNTPFSLHLFHWTFVLSILLKNSKRKLQDTVSLGTAIIHFGIGRIGKVLYIRWLWEVSTATRYASDKELDQNHYQLSITY